MTFKDNKLYFLQMINVEKLNNINYLEKYTTLTTILNKWN